MHVCACVCDGWTGAPPPAPTELLPGWRPANRTRPGTKPQPSSHNQREREENKGGGGEGQKGRGSTERWGGRIRSEKQEEEEEGCFSFVFFVDLRR